MCSVKNAYFTHMCMYGCMFGRTYINVLKIHGTDIPGAFLAFFLIEQIAKRENRHPNGIEVTIWRMRNESHMWLICL